MDNKMVAEKVLGSEGAKFFEMAGALVSSFECDSPTYGYMDPDEFKSLMDSDRKAGTKVYWEELLGRAHFAAAASVIRAHRWLSGMCVSYSNNLFLPFCASFRALIESAADGYDALSNVGASLAELRGDVNKILNFKSETVLLAAKLEDQLIHFSHARKLNRDEEAPSTHSAKQAAGYVRMLEKAMAPNLYECYSELCQYTHPAAHSVVNLLMPLSEDEWTLVPEHDQIRIDALLERYESIVLPLLMSAFNPGVLVLKVLLYFESPKFHSSGVRRLDLSNVGGWGKYAKTMGVQA